MRIARKGGLKPALLAARPNRAEFSHSLVSEWNTSGDHSLTLAATYHETSISLH